MSRQRLLLAVVVLAVAAPAAQCAEGLFFDVLPTVINNRALVPLRPIAEWLGASVEQRDGKIVASKGPTIHVELTLGSTAARIANRDFVLEAPAQSIRGRVMVPLRFIAEGFGAWVDYKQRQITLTIAQENKQAVMVTPPDPRSHEGKMQTVLEQYYGLAPLPKPAGVQYPHVQLLLSKRYRQELEKAAGGAGLVEESWGGRGVKGIRVEKDYYDGRLTGWADLVVLYGDDKAERERLAFVKEATGWKVDGVQREKEQKPGPQE